MPANGASVDVEWGGCRLTDESSVEEMHALTGREFFYYGEAGVADAITLIEGEPPWKGHPAPRPVYRIRWRPNA